MLALLAGRHRRQAVRGPPRGARENAPRRLRQGPELHVLSVRRLEASAAAAQAGLVRQRVTACAHSVDFSCTHGLGSSVVGEWVGWSVG